MCEKLYDMYNSTRCMLSQADVGSIHSGRWCILVHFEPACLRHNVTYACKHIASSPIQDPVCKGSSPQTPDPTPVLTEYEERSETTPITA